MPETSFRKLISIAKKLRSKNGCPWDKAKTIETLEGDFKAEADEVIQAIQKKDYRNLKEELGDILFNIILISQIAEEKKIFNIKEVLEDIQKKIISRHTWVFGKDKAKTAEEALELWKKNKKKEKK